MTGEWPTKRLEAVAELSGGFAFKSADYAPEGRFVLRTLNIGDDGTIHRNDAVFLPHEKIHLYKRFDLQVHDTLFVMVGATLGKVGYVRRETLPALLNQNMWRIRGRDGLCDKRYLQYAFRHTAAKNLGWASGSARDFVRRDDYRTMEIPVPPLDEQKAIAAMLGALDDKIELNRRMNAMLETMARALFQSWFVDFDPVRAKLDSRQPPGLDPITAALFPEHFEESSIGKTPVGWEVAALETTLAVLETGGRPKGGVGGITGGVPSIGAESIVGIGQFDFNKTKFVPAAFFNNMKKGHIQSHDVLLYKDGGRPGEYEPHVSMFGNGFPFENCGINEHVYRLRANGRLSQEYLYFWLTSELALAEMRIKGTGIAIPGLNSTAVRSLAVLVPPHPVVEAFTRHATPLVARIFANARQSRTLSTMRDTLLPKLLSGELRLDHPASLAA